MPIRQVMIIEKIIENRKSIVPKMDTIKLCGRLCKGLRGNRDIYQYYSDVVGTPLFKSGFH